jgi:hypothetical protein
MVNSSWYLLPSWKHGEHRTSVDWTRKTIWDAMMQIYFNAPGVVSMTNIVTTELYAEMVSHMRPNIPDLLTMAQQYGRPEAPINLPVEKARLLAGEYLYSLFWAYRAFIGGIALRLAACRDEGHFQPWWEDDHVRDLLRTVLTDEEFQEFTALQIGKFLWVTRTLEGKFLLAATDIVDGRRAATDAFEQAREILGAAEAIGQQASTHE